MKRGRWPTLNKKVAEVLDQTSAIDAKEKFLSVETPAKGSCYAGESCAKQQKRARLRGCDDNAANLAAGEGRVVDIAVGLIVVKTRKESGLSPCNRTASRCDVSTGIGGSEGQIEGVGVRSGECIWEPGKWYCDRGVVAGGDTAVNVRGAGVSAGEAGPADEDGQHIAIE